LISLTHSIEVKTDEIKQLKQKEMMTRGYIMRNRW